MDLVELSVDDILEGNPIVFFAYWIFPFLS